MKDNIKIKARITFLESSIGRVNFPIDGERRISFYLKGDKGTTPSKLTPIAEPIKNALVSYEANLLILNRDFLDGRVKVGSAFYLNSLSDPLCEGVVLTVEEEA